MTTGDFEKMIMHERPTYESCINAICDAKKLRVAWFMRRHACVESFTGAEKGIRELLSKKRCSVQMHLHITRKNKCNNYLNAAPHSITRYDSL